jgi:hypothetical protein
VRQPGASQCGMIIVFVLPSYTLVFIPPSLVVFMQYATHPLHCYETEDGSVSSRWLVKDLVEYANFLSVGPKLLITTSFC